MKTELTDNERFVQRVMTNLPERQSLAERVWQGLLRFVMSPLWLWLGLVVLVVVLRRPLLSLISVMPQMSPWGLVGSWFCLLSIPAFCTYQMVRDITWHKN